VLRGEEHLVNTPKQILICRALNLPEPEFAHVPLILGADGKKLSKRTGDTALGDYIDQGYPQEAMFNFLCLLGFAIDDETTVFDAEQLVGAFDLRKINKSGAIFDTDKLSWLCGDYIRNTPISELTSRVSKWLIEDGLLSGSESAQWLEKLVAVHQARLGLYGEIGTQTAWAFTEKVEPDVKAAKALAHESAPELLAKLAQALEENQIFPPADFDQWIKDLATQLEVGMGKLMKPTRAALTGSLGGPPVGDILEILGKDRALQRLRN